MYTNIKSYYILIIYYIAKSYKQALKFSEDHRSGLLTHTHTQSERETG